MFLCETLITTPSPDLQMVLYLELKEAGARENGWRGVLWLGSNIKVSVAASYVMGKCQTDVFVSVFCDVRDSMKLPCDRERLRNSAVSLYFLEIPHFTLVEEPKVFKNNVRDIYSASLKLCIFFLLKLSCVPLCTLFLS